MPIARIDAIRLRIKVRTAMSSAHSLLTNLGICLLSSALIAQQPVDPPSSNLPSNLGAAMTVVPHLVNFSGNVIDGQGKPISGIAGVTFAIYKDQYEGAPLWLETQNVAADAKGNYTVQLGATKPAGLPLDLFTSGEAHWLGVQVSGQAEQPRVLLLSVPYALKAADAETVGGLPASAFVLATQAPVGGGSSTNNAVAPSASTMPPASSDVTTTGGTANTLPLFTTATNVKSSAITQTGTGTTAKIGIGTTAPAAVLDVKGSETVRGLLTLPTTGVASATAGKYSQAEKFVASSFSSASNAALNQTFQWQAEPANNNTASPGATLNLLYGLGTAPPTETGLLIGPKGIIAFAPGQTFPNVSGNETLTGNFSSGGSVNATTSFDIGGTAFAFGSAANANAFLGFAGNSSMSGAYNTASGYQALAANTTGASNSAFGRAALFSNTIGIANTALGAASLYGNTTGSYNTATGEAALAVNNTGSYNTASGFKALNQNQSGGYNTAAGSDALFTNTTGSQNTAMGSTALYWNSTGMSNTAVGFQALNNNNTGGLNTASGVNALFSNTSGGQNTADGFSALYWNSTGLDNTASGFQALNNNTTGYGNTAAGADALFTDTTGGNNAAFGAYALYSNTTANGNTADGYAALYWNTAANNTAVGFQTLNSNTTGADNSAVGYDALFTNTVGYDNTATGFNALYSNTTGWDNTADGWNALRSNTQGTYNTATGNQTMYWNTTGENNTADGYASLNHNTTGGVNTATGALALNVNTTGAGNTGDGVYALAVSNGDDNTAVGAYALGNNTTGAQNTAVGYFALVNNNTGNGLTCVGYSCETGSDALTNATAIGAHAKVSQSNSLVLGGAGAYAVRVGIGTDAPSSVLTIARGAGHPVSDSWETYSSRRWKTNIQSLRNALGTVEQLRGVSYELKDSGRHEIGVIAEEVGAVVPEVVTYEENGKDARGVDYSRLTALLIEAIKQQQLEIQQQKITLRTQAAAIRGLKSDLQATLQTLRNVGAKVAASRLDEVAAK
jgi:hypothetical protein